MLPVVRIQLCINISMWPMKYRKKNTCGGKPSNAFQGRNVRTTTAFVWHAVAGLWGCGAAATVCADLR